MDIDNEKQKPGEDISRDGVQRAARAERLKQSLRVNLRRRKARSRAIRSEGKDEAD